MNDMLTRLDDSARRQHRFVADASHELLSPLAAIRTTLEVGLAHTDQAPWPVIADRAVQQAARLEDLIHQLLLLAKADERLLTAQRQLVDLGQLLHDILTSIHTHRLGLDLDLAPDVVTAGNPDHLERLFRNVIDNALRFARTRVVIRAATATTTVQVEILDHGPGIPATERDRVFDRFLRLSSSRERSSGSTGLGLAIAREIATARSGHITAADADGEGARIVITLPRATDAITTPHDNERIGTDSHAAARTGARLGGYAGVYGAPRLRGRRSGRPRRSGSGTAPG